MKKHSLKNTEEEPIRTGSSAAAPAAHTRYLSSPAGATLHGKTQGFVPKLSPKTKPMQHPCSHYNAFCTLMSPTRLSLRTWQRDNATFMQPFHCDLQPKIPNQPTTAHTQSHPQHLEATVPLRQKRNVKTIVAAPAAHTRYLSSPAVATLHGKTQGFVPN